MSHRENHNNYVLFLKIGSNFPLCSQVSVVYKGRAAPAIPHPGLVELSAAPT